jgi:type VI secretion system protein ImpA
MPLIEVGTLLSPISEESPCGLDLEYDQEFTELEDAAKFVPEQRFKHKDDPARDVVKPAREPDWEEVQRRAVGLLGKTKDLRVAVLLLRALTRNENLSGLSVGLQVIAGLVDRYWQGVHPRLDSEDGDDPTLRVNSLASLRDPATLLSDLRSAAFFRSPTQGSLLVSDIETAAGAGPGKAPGSSLAGVEPIVATLVGEVAQFASTAGVIKAAWDAIESLNSRLEERLGPEKAPDLRELRGMIKLLQFVGDRVMVAARGVGTGGGDQVGSVADLGAVGAVRSRDDALRLLDKVCEYLERAEPTNPAPLLIRRAQKIMSKNFVDIIRHLLPNSVSDIETLAGIEKD